VVNASLNKINNFSLTVQWNDFAFIVPSLIIPRYIVKPVIRASLGLGGDETWRSQLRSAVSQTPASRQRDRPKRIGPNCAQLGKPGCRRLL